MTNAAEPLLDAGGSRAGVTPPNKLAWLEKNRARVEVVDPPVVRFKRNDDAFGKIVQKPLRDAAKDESLSTDLRVFCLAAGHAHNNGHTAPGFLPGQLGRLLSTKRDGEPIPLSQSAVDRSISRLSKAGLLAKGSNSRCLALPTELWSQALGKPRRCGEHNTFSPFYADGFEAD